MAVKEATSTAMSNGHRHHGDIKGTTTIADSVVATIAGIATRDAPGVYAMGSSMTRTLGAARDMMARSGDVTRGVQVEVGQKQAAVDIDVVVEYGYPITRTTEEIRTGIADAVETMTGLEIAEVNIDILDVHVPGSDEGSGEEPRAR
ncbi:Asp23/Gls24 family envelope stress response protein [Streptomyces sp. NPDC058665]|uniref:Asp23/Gls24 family envelope stress response protein n=1 Tax=Streptomyces sp. NPDC058665 TaxID=3346586 RepID=UPI00365894F7